MLQSFASNVSCPNHNQPISYIDTKKDTPINNRAKCLNCTPLNDAVPLKTALEKFKKLKEDEKQQIRNYRKNKVYDFLEFKKVIHQLSESISQSLNEISKQINERIEKIVGVIQQAQSVQWQFDINEYLTISGLQNVGLQLSQQGNEFSLIKAGYSVVQMKKEQQLQTTLSNYQNNIKSIQSNMEILKESLTTNLIINEEIVGKAVQKEKCLATAFNKDNSIMISTSEELIKVWTFDNGKLELFQTLKGHDKEVTCLYFSRKNNWFISGSRDKTLRIWKEFSNSEWGCIQILEGNSFCINCVIINQYEDQILSSRDDNKIKVWMQESLLTSQQPQWKCYQTLQDHKKDVYSLSLNSAGTMLVSGSYDKTIIIYEFDDQQQWRLKQVIQNDYENWVHSVCVINDKLIATKLYNGVVILYQYMESVESFEQIQELELSKSKMSYFDFFHMFYNQQLQSIFCRHLDCIYILFQQTTGRYGVQQKIADNYRGGSLTDNGEYIALWNNNTKQLEIRQQE
ncbi:unnamed protein product (macronuclear) [Paramecium tetraurelia]|uniref:Uncharacterized protein n=1 Tax=Paramecium tetraurelia TaxID=5888 RepID=A0DE36_PARTE|nr:uncharacterized protein GSPATT00016145001 [Paramecium tetraurelia]CAK81303.1 unnamed protein product [Paramecium tetraurelia]|eukprot:XP_001448700.1 hypothetical protein (macronuclear) [Paramecium tetraurelia strain d4-2]